MTVGLGHARKTGRSHATRGKHVRHDCSAYASRLPALFRQQRKRTPKLPKALLRKEILPVLLMVSDLALRVYLGRARFLNCSSALSYPRSEFLLRTLGSPELYSCILCGAPNHRLTKVEREKRKKRFLKRVPLIEAADAELCRAGLLKPEVLFNSYAEFPGTRFLLPDGSAHVIPKRAPANTFFGIPESFYMSGAGAIWQRKDYGLYPLPEDALRLLLVMLCEQDLARFGGVNPNVLAFRDEELIAAGMLADWDGRYIEAALYKLFDSGFVSRRAATVSRFDGHLIRKGFAAAFPDEENLQILEVQTTYNDLRPRRARSL